MGTKLTLNDISNLQNESTVVTTLAQNNRAIEDAVEKTLSRDGTLPNGMTSSLDMNSQRIINLPQPISNSEPARLIDVGNSPLYASNAAASAAAALISETNASNSATSASTSAAQAFNYVTGLSGTSTSSVAIGTGAKSFTTSLNKLWVAGQTLSISSNANSANFMHGTVTSYDGPTGALVMNILDIGGSGTKTDWNITVAGSQGPTGPQGPSGAVGITGTPSANQFATWASSTNVQGVSITGLVKGNGASAPAAAVSGTDYQAPIGTISGIAKGNGANALTAATAGTDYQSPIGTISGIAKGNGANALTAATAGTDYLAPAAIGTTVQAFDAQLFGNIPQNSQGAAYTLVASDANKHIYHNAVGTHVYTIPANSSVAYPIGTTVTFYNDNTSGSVTISITSDTLVQAGTNATGSRTLAAGGLATAMKVQSTKWIISGSGLI